MPTAPTALEYARRMRPVASTSDEPVRQRIDHRDHCYGINHTRQKQPRLGSEWDEALRRLAGCYTAD